MRNTLILVAIAALAFTSIADAKSCKDPTTHKFVKCPAAAAAAAAKPMTMPMVKGKGKDKDVTTASTPVATKTASGAGKAPHCVKGKACGNSCIKMSDVCHK